MTMNERETGGWAEKQEADQQDEALPFPNRLFLSHPAISSVSISLSAFWLIRSNGVSVRACVWERERGKSIDVCLHVR